MKPLLTLPTPTQPRQRASSRCVCRNNTFLPSRRLSTQRKYGTPLRRSTSSKAQRVCSHSVGSSTLWKRRAMSQSASTLLGPAHSRTNSEPQDSGPERPTSRWSCSEACQRPTTWSRPSSRTRHPFRHSPRSSPSSSSQRRACQALSTPTQPTLATPDPSGLVHDGRSRGPAPGSLSPPATRRRPAWRTGNRTTAWRHVAATTVARKDT